MPSAMLTFCSVLKIDAVIAVRSWESKSGELALLSERCQTIWCPLAHGYNIGQLAALCQINLDVHQQKCNKMWKQGACVSMCYSLPLHVDICYATADTHLEGRN